MGLDKIKESSSLLPLDTDLNSILDWYRTSIFEDFSFPCSKWDETLERNSYEIEMFSRLAYDYEQLEKVDQKELKVVIEELLRGGRRKQAHIQKTRKIFLEDREELLPYAFEYQNNTYTQSYLPRKASLQAFYDKYLDAWDEESSFWDGEIWDYDNYD